MKALLALLVFAAVVEAQAFTNALWPPRDVDTKEDFGNLEVGLDEDFLAVLDRREGEPAFVRVYQREGLNWIEDARLSILPPLRGRSTTLDVDGERVVVAGSGVIEIFRRFGPRNWKRRVVEAPVLTGDLFGFLADLAGDWLAVASSRRIHLFQRQQNEWLPTQEIPIPNFFHLALEGDNLLITLANEASLANQAMVYRQAGGTWTQEFRTQTTTTLCDLDGDRLGVILRDEFRSFDRVGSSWIPSGSFPIDADRVLLTDGHAILGLLRPFTVLWHAPEGWSSLGTLAAPDPTLHLGINLAAAGPLVACGSFTALTENLRGAVFTFALDGSRATLLANPMRMALESGGTLTLTLDAGAENAGMVFALGGSLSGSSPGFVFQGQRIPLNQRGDPYYPHSLRLGRLDGEGRATVAVVLPSVQSGEPLAFLKDRTLHHAFALWDGRRFTHVSNVALTAIVGRFR